MRERCGKSRNCPGNCRANSNERKRYQHASLNCAKSVSPATPQYGITYCENPVRCKKKNGTAAQQRRSKIASQTTRIRDRSVEESDMTLKHRSNRTASRKFLRKRCFDAAYGSDRAKLVRHAKSLSNKVPCGAQRRKNRQSRGHRLESNCVEEVPPQTVR